MITDYFLSTHFSSCGPTKFRLSCRNLNSPAMIKVCPKLLASAQTSDGSFGFLSSWPLSGNKVILSAERVHFES